MSNLRNVVYLTEAQLEELRTNGTVTVNGTTIEYSDEDLYITPLDDFDGVYATEADLTAVESSVLDNEERIETLENETVKGLAVQGQGQFTVDDITNDYIKVAIPSAIRAKLPFIWSAKITYSVDVSGFPSYIGVAGGTMHNAGTESAAFVGCNGSLIPLTAGQLVTIEAATFGRSGETDLRLPIKHSPTIGNYYCYKIEFIC